MSRLPVVALVGRPNVGKSTLFNRLTRSRAALVADRPGLTRDRHYGRGRMGEIPYIVIDTGGFEPVAKQGIEVEMARQARQAVLEADVVLFIVDGRQGLTGHDREIAAELRRNARRIMLAVNKTEGMLREAVAAEFHELGLGEPLAISAAHGDGVRDLAEAALAPFVEEAAREAERVRVEAEAAEAAAAAQPEAASGGATPQSGAASAAEAGEGGAAADAGAVDLRGPRRVKVAVVGRPNAGKSTLINALLGEERLIAFDQPGTTRDSVAIDFERGRKPYTLIDTAGVRRRGKVTDMIEKFSVVKTLQAIEDCNVCVLMLDAREGVADQDANIAGYILEAGRSVVLAVNKWDAIDESQRERLKSELDRRLHFLRFARTHFISALNGTGLGALMRSVDDAFAAAMRKLPTPKLTRALVEAVQRQQPPRKGPIRPKLRYAHQGGQNPPIVVIHGTSLDAVPETYRRYLESWFREQFSLEGTPLRIEFRTGSNPYAP
ncbi:MAG TPA: ribosome biogenesis GTPase Der [Quisquiliibacterium sp.]|nr:ribosome biogenesis GTPase Der [Quisquiliibacterium sp.]